MAEGHFYYFYVDNWDDLYFFSSFRSEWIQDQMGLKLSTKAEELDFNIHNLCWKVHFTSRLFDFCGPNVSSIPWIQCMSPRGNSGSRCSIITTEAIDVQSAAAWPDNPWSLLTVYMLADMMRNHDGLPRFRPPTNYRPTVLSTRHLSAFSPSVVPSTCRPAQPCCSGDDGIITEIYIVLEEIGGLSPGVMFGGPSLLWSALSHWFPPSLSPISPVPASLQRRGTV